MAANGDRDRKDVKTTVDDAKDVSYLTLGDGDFSYSLDFCRYLVATAETRGHDFFAEDEKGSPCTSAGTRPLRIRCTGIDSLEELRAKYLNVDSILRKIRALGKNGGKKARGKKRSRPGAGAPCNSAPVICIDHEINAIVTKTKGYAETGDCGKVTYDHVLFNHPHLGTESAPLHARFLSHLFRSIHDHWLSSGGIFHLTLVVGQADRWNCLDSAEKHGFALLHRGPFRPPPPPPSGAGLGSGTYFQQRRHQSGRSFANRARGGSETLTFGRFRDKGRYVGAHLPWQLLPESHWEDDASFQCPHCPKTFREERSRKSHIKNAHPVPDDGASSEGKQLHKNDTDVPFVCEICKVQSDAPTELRIFPTAQGLADHIRAKHSSVHTDIKPDWQEQEVVEEVTANGGATAEFNVDLELVSTESSAEACGLCEICGLKYSNEEDKLRHASEFVPRFTAVSKTGETGRGEQQLPFQCPHCSKRFRERRAVRQHENFCSVRAK